jgi:hypothetical protein
MSKLTDIQKRHILDLYFNSKDNSILLIASIVGVEYAQVDSYINYFMFERPDDIIRIKSNTKIFHSKINRQKE